MGQRLLDIYSAVTKHKGFKGRLRLADKTGYSKTKAASVEDSPELISIFERAAREILGKDLREYQ